MQRGTRILLLLTGGDKSTQQNDIETAIHLPWNFQEQHATTKPAAKKPTNTSRESLYRALSADGNPSFATVLKIARALGVKLHAATA